MTKTDQKIALVTGASSGIGEATATLLAEEGYRVFGTSRRVSLKNRNFEMIELDVTDDESVAKCISTVIAKAGRIDLLVNNAGYSIVGFTEECSVAQAQQLFNTNVFGAIRMTKQVLPLMRSQGAGRILHVGSILGRVPYPFMGLYASTKHALEGYSESLDHEIRTLNVRSIIIEPSYTKTNIGHNNVTADETLEAYNDLRGRLGKALEAGFAGADTAESVAETILAAATDTKPKVRYVSGKSAKSLSLIRRILPSRIFDKGFRKEMGLE